MKQKYLNDGSVYVEFSYKGVFYSKKFSSNEELKTFLKTL